MPAPKRQESAFTLVELLVVVTIILILVAMLVPAMSRAVYQAQLTVDAANLDAIAGGTALYAMDFGRRYPNRPGNREAEDTTSFAPFYLKSRTDNNPLNARDLRPIVRGYIGAQNWPCALSRDADLSEEANEGVDRVYAGYNLFFGFTYTRTGDWLGTGTFGTKTAEQGMIKLGDRWTFTNQTPEGAPVTRYFDVLACDIDWQKWNGESFGSHPDDARTMAFFSKQGEMSPWAGDGTFTWTWWQKGETQEPQTRGRIDMNAARADGSVTRYNHLKAEKFSNPGFADVALFDTRFGYSGEWINVPEQFAPSTSAQSSGGGGSGGSEF